MRTTKANAKKTKNSNMPASDKPNSLQASIEVLHTLRMRIARYSTTSDKCVIVSSQLSTGSVSGLTSM
eukprot:CAMPEP_0119320954 /NCGR_PEP_ID=MMETSP1333-20130426/53999_1 /TAXON_ID=418940 /ORGANISM="Scyphosphaera apsteinii, Strain RCC1455" /LENGTH=67 /DNA_ID=CAMNT_0007327797 /DNA_START=12 /DNA_END=215 /DNA_ORIENTATION=+